MKPKYWIAILTLVAVGCFIVGLHLGIEAGATVQAARDTRRLEQFRADFIQRLPLIHVERDKKLPAVIWLECVDGEADRLEVEPGRSAIFTIPPCNIEKTGAVDDVGVQAHRGHQ